MPMVQSAFRGRMAPEELLRYYPTPYERLREVTTV